MKNLFIISLTMISTFCFAQDVKRCENSEPTYINRMPGFYISECKNSDYNDVEFIYYVGGKAHKISKGGKYYHIYYTKNDNESQKFSAAQINKNYHDAVVKVNGKALDDRKTIFSASINGKEVYLQVNTAPNSTDSKSYNIEVVEVESMKQSIVLDLNEAINKDGKVALYGILFDVGKSDIKPESELALKQVIDYLTKNPVVKIIIVGHTDNTGIYSENITLSKVRAESIKNYLVTTGKIDVSRLKSEGVGSLCPITSNTTIEGKSLNRRVEIVIQ